MNGFFELLKRQKKLLPIFFIGLVLLSLPVALFLIRQSQDIRQRASGLEGAGQATLSSPTFFVYPGDIQLSNGSTTEGGLSISDNSKKISAATIEIKYNNKALKIDCIQNTVVSCFTISSDTVRLLVLSNSAITPGSKLAAFQIKRISAGNGTILPRIIECIDEKSQPLQCDAQGAATSVNIVPSKTPTPTKKNPIPTSKLCTATLSRYTLDESGCSGKRGYGRSMKFVCSDGYTSTVKTTTCSTDAQLRSLAALECQKRRSV